MRIFLFLLLLPVLTFAQHSTDQNFQTQLSFIENKGQFDGRNWQRNEIKFGIENDNTNVFFTKSGLTYRFDKIIRNPERKESDFDSPKRTNISELIHVFWIGANEDVEIIAEGEREEYFSYAIRDLSSRMIRNENFVKGYRKITYKNIYDNIDIEYEIHPINGFEYNIILHQGADPSVVRCKYIADHTSLGMEHIDIKQDENGDIVFNTFLATLKEHKPFSYYSDDRSEIESGFRFEDGILSFELGNFNPEREVIIDPWVQSSNFTTSTAVWEVETDGFGNVYVIGGETPMELKKYTSGGALLWTYTTPWDTASVWLGTLATDAFGESYITSGTSPEIEMVNTSGGMVWHNESFTLFGLTEWWSITFNCDKSKLIVGGTGGSVPPFGTPLAVIYDMDITNGDVIEMETVHTGGTGGFINSPIEVRSISSSKDAKYVFLTHRHVGAIMDNIGACPNSEPVFKVDNNHHLGYKCEDYLPATQNGGGLKAIIANDLYFYTHSGVSVYKWSLDDGTLISSVGIPGGGNGTVLGDIVVENSGLDVDECGNVYVGSKNRVVKFDQDLNYITEAAVGFTVYDVDVNSNGEVVAVGAQFDNESTNRNGQIQSVNLSACAQFALVCCDANICPVDPVCDSDPAFNISVSEPGGTFSGTGITDANAGTFNPAVAGPGTYTITYSKPCGFETVEIIVNPCLPVSVCYDGVNLVATGGTGTIIWEDWETISTPITNEQQCIDCPFTTPEYFFGIYTGCSENSCNGTGWVEIGTGSTISAPANWPIQVSDNNGVGVTFNNLSEVPNCSGCSAPVLTYTTTPVTCVGGSDGSINLTVSGPSAYSFAWSGSQTTEDISGLTVGTYTVTVTDTNDPSCYTISTISVANSGTGPNPSITGNITICDGNTAVLDAGSGYSAYSWSNGGTTQITNATVSGTYTVTVTDGNGCTGSDNVVVTVNPIPNANAGPDQTICLGSTVTLTATGGTAYSWNTGQNASSITVSPASQTTYTVTVTANGCSATDNVTVSISSQLSVFITPTDSSVCPGNSTQLTATGGNTFLWSNAQTTGTITVSPASSTTYYVTASDASGCTGTASFTVGVDAIPIANAGADQTICSGTGATISASGGSTYAWSNGSSSQSVSINPSSTTTYTVTVSNGSCSSTDQVTVFVSAPVIANITATLPTVCLGQSTTLSASGGDTYQWSTGDAGSSITVTPLSTTNYYVTATSAAGCSDQSQIMINVADSVVVVVSPPVICDGESTTLTASAGTSYLWSTGETTQTILVSPPTTTDYSVTVTDNGCSGSTDVTVTVSQSPAAFAGTDQQICNGDSAVLIATGGFQYEWGNGSINDTILVYPVSTTTYNVTVSQNGCSASDAVIVYVNPIPVANAGPDQIICEGESVILYANNFSDSYLWSTGETSQSISVSPAVTQSYSVTVFENGCSATDEVLVSVNEIPTADAGPDQGICAGDFTTLNATGGSSYYWNVQVLDSSITVAPVQTTTYYVTVTEGSCSAIDSVTVTVSEAVSGSITASPSTICETQSSDLTAFGGTEFLWSTGDTTQVITITPQASTLYYVTITSNGCSDIANIQITVNPGITATSSPSQICEGETTVLTVSAGDVYLWSTGETTQSISVSPSSTTYYHVTVSGNACTDSTSVLVTVNSVPAASAGADVSICRGETTTLLATGGVGYLWSNSISANTITVQPQITTTYTVTVTSLAGCTDTDNATVTVNPLPEAHAGNDIIVCSGTSVQLDGSGGGSYNWSPSSGLSATNIANPDASPVATTTYTLLVTDANGCTDTDEVLLTINPDVTVNLSIYALPSSEICAGEEITFTAIPEGEGYNPVYQWKIDNINVGENSPVFVTSGITEDVTVSCILTSSEACVVNNPAVAFIQVVVNPIPKIDILANNIKGCAPLTVQLDEVGVNNGTYLWDFGDGTTSTDRENIHIYENTGSYNVSLIVNSENGCMNSVAFTNLVRVYPSPVAEFYADPDYTSLTKPLVFFQNESVGGYIEIASFGDGDSTIVLGGNDFYHTFDLAGLFDVQLVSYSEVGCNDTAWAQVEITPVYTFYAPTAIVPNRDGDNSKFFVLGAGISTENFLMQIYDRWGEVIFETDKYSPSDPASYGWDGKVKGNYPAEIGVYTWLVIYFDESGVKHQENGSVTVIR